MVERLHPVGITALICDKNNHNVQDTTHTHTHTHTHTLTNPAVRLSMLEYVHRTQMLFQGLDREWISEDGLGGRMGGAVARGFHVTPTVIPL